MAENKNDRGGVNVSDTSDIKTFEIKKRITDIFQIFTTDSSDTINIKEIGTIVRALNCYPSEADLHDIFREVEDEDAPGMIKQEKFTSFMVKALLENRYKAASKKRLKEAFKVIDTENQGFIDPEKMKKLLLEEGEPFTMEEVDEMFSVAVNQDKNVIYYDDYILTLLDETVHI